MNEHEATYRRILHSLLFLPQGSTRHDVRVEVDRTGVGTRARFGVTESYDLRHSFPLLTGKRLFWRGIVEELLWMLRGETDARTLQDKGVHIWDAWTLGAQTGLGPVYGYQWRSWEGRIDQLAEAVRLIRENPMSRRILVSAWNVAALPEMALPPCPTLFQLYVDGPRRERLSMLLFQRSADTFLGVPWDLAGYSLLLHLLASLTGKRPHRLVHVLADAHLYLSHLEPAREYLGKDPPPAPRLKVPVLRDQPVEVLHDLRFEDLDLIDYDPLPPIPAPLAV